MYPTKSTGGIGTGPPFFYQQSSDVLDDSNFADSNADVSNSGNGQFHISFGSSDSVTLGRHREFFADNANSIGGCDMDFPQTAARGYSYKADDPRDVELKMVIRVTSASAGHGLSLKGPSGHHDSPTPCCQGHGYMFSMEDLSDSPQHFRFRKEMWHVNYDDHPGTRTWTHSLFPNAFEDEGWIGICFVRYNKKDGVSRGKDSVVVEGWANPTPDTNKNNWVMLKRVEDKGGWGDGGDECGGDKDQILTWSSGQFIIKATDLEMDVKNLSLREIDPTKSFDDNTGGGQPEEPEGEITTVQGTFKVQWDVNQLRTSTCAGAGTTIFYSETNPTEDRGVGFTSTPPVSDSLTIKKVGQHLADSSSVMDGKIIKQLDVPLRKQGLPTTPNIQARIWSSGGSVVYTSPTVIDPSTLTGSFTTQIFDFSSNTRTFVTGDKVGIEWNTSTPSDTDYIVVGYNSGTVGASEYAHYYTNTGWTVLSSRDFACTMWE